MSLVSKISGALYGTAIGDGMGAPVEGWMPERIGREFGRHTLRTFLPPTHGGDPARGKGDGRITDDTLMTEVLIRAYIAKRGHLDAPGYADFMLPLIMDKPMWIPELQTDTPLYNRLWFPEKYPAMRMRVNNVDPRVAGVGNCVNCGVAMWIMPVGAVNAGDPAAAYQEAVAIGAAHNESFAVEAAGALAAAHAAAFAPGASVREVLAAARSFSREGTHAAIEACLDATRSSDPLNTWIRKVRRAMEPFDQRTAHVDDEKPLVSKGLTNIGLPSRLHAIEELPAALAALQYGGANFAKVMRAGVFYGRDCDSIASMALGLYGAINGVERVPAALRKASDRANRRDFSALGAAFARTVRTIARSDSTRLRAHLRAVNR